ncbi:MAG TPA: hypothetical protein VG710_18095, partial [Opitutus sp.]|nr:hypothetical protein [Opitutus sp.]
MRKLSTLLLPAVVMSAVVPLAGIAQTTSPDVTAPPRDEFTLPQAGTRELTIGGSGGSNKN